jgi:hypothetical protein
MALPTAVKADPSEKKPLHPSLSRRLTFGCGEAGAQSITKVMHSQQLRSGKEGREQHALPAVFSAKLR